MLATVRKTNPTSGDVHVNRPLTNVAIHWIQDQDRYIAAQVFPVVNVQKQSDLYYVYDRPDWLRAVAEKRAPATESAGGGFRLTTDSYFADVWAFHKDVADQNRANADVPLNPDRSATQFSTQACMTRRELEWSESYFQSGVWGNESQGVASGPTGTEFLQWDVSGSTPITDLRTRKNQISGRTGFTPNVLVLGSDVWTVLQDNPDFVDRVNRGQTPGSPAIVNRAALAQILELDEVLVSEAVINTGAEQGTENTGFVLGKNALLVYRTDAPSIDQPSGGYTFAWTGMFGAQATGARIRRFRMESLAADRVECEMAWDLKLVAAELGHFMNECVS